jgi:hypothetical protein
MASNRPRVLATSLVTLTSALTSTGAFAGVVVGNAPAPGILVLVALGVIGAIAIARRRK